MNRFVLKGKQILKDESGQVMTEYLITTILGLLIAAYFLYPGNGLYQYLRARYDLMYWLLTFPGP